MPPDLQVIDHVHVFVADRTRAEAWYGKVLGLRRSKELEFWATDGGPLTVQNESGSVHIALFERPVQPCRSVVAIRVSAAGYRAWKTHLEGLLPGKVGEQDHEASRSLYFTDPDGNPYELTTYEISSRRDRASS